MKRRKRQKKSSLAPRPKHTASERVTQAVLAHDIARYSAETVYYRIATLQKAAAGTLDPEIFAMVAERMLTAGEAAAIAARQIVPLHRLWTGAWFEQLSAFQQAWRQEKIGYDVGRTFTDMAMRWLTADSRLDAATLAHMKPVHRTAKSHARRLEESRVH